MIPSSFALQAASVPDVLSTLPLTLVAPALGLAVVVGMAFLFVSRYRRCPANRVLVISGRVGGDGAAKCISGGGAFVWPVIQEYAYLSLEPIQIDIPLKDALSLENIRVAVPSVFTVAIGTEAEVRQNAAIRLLGSHARPDQAAGAGHHLRTAAAGDRLDEHRADQPRPRELPAPHPHVARAGAARRSGSC
jgi:flotillin